MSEQRICATEHLREYPGCYEECDKDKCDGKPLEMSEQDELLLEEIATYIQLHLADLSNKVAAQKAKELLAKFLKHKRKRIRTEDCRVYLESQGKKWSPYITPDQYPCNECPFKVCKLVVKERDRPELREIRLLLLNTEFIEDDIDRSDIGTFYFKESGLKKILDCLPDIPKDRPELEKVIEILREVYWEEFDYSQPEWKEQGNKWFSNKAKQIMALFQSWKSPVEVKELLQDEHNQHIGAEEEAEKQERERTKKDIKKIIIDVGIYSELSHQLEKYLEALKGEK